jgi:hypothetical protein
MVEEAWRKKMLISKMRADRNETSRVENHGHKKELTKILSHLSNLEASARRIAEDQRSQNEKMERMARTIPPLHSLCPPHGNKSIIPAWNTSWHQKFNHTL